MYMHTLTPENKVVIPYRYLAMDAVQRYTMHIHTYMYMATG